MARALWQGWRVVFKLNHKNQSRQIRKPESSGVYAPGLYKKTFLDSGFSSRYETISVLAPNKAQANKFAKEKMKKLYPKDKGWSWHVDKVIPPSKPN